MSDPVQNKMSELKVSGHTMTLEPGLYCVLNNPGSGQTAPESGLPAVRLGAAPGNSKGKVAIAGFDADGWVHPASGTLLRISGAPSDVLVTIYQAKDATAAAPQLQVLRLDAGPQQAPAPKPPARPREVNVLAHVYGRGDVGGLVGEWMGEPGSKQWIEGFGISPGAVPMTDIEYQAVLGRGWLSPWAKGGEFCGSRGMSLPLLGLRVRLTGDSAKTHTTSLEASFVDGSRSGPVTGAETCEAPSLAALEAFRLTILPGTQQTQAKGKAAAPASQPATKAASKPAAKPAMKPATKPGAAKASSKAPSAPAPLPQTPKPKPKRR